MASLGDALLIKLGLDLSGFKKDLNDAVHNTEQTGDKLQQHSNKITNNASANIAKINAQASSTLNNVLGLAKRLAGPVTAALSFGAMIKSYWGGMGQVAEMTGAYYKQLDAWREKMAALRRYTREDLELYRRTNRAMTDFRIAMADLSAELMRSFNPLWKVALEGLEKFTKFISENKDDVVRFLKVVAAVVTTALIPAFVKLTATMLANPITWVIGLIMALALAIDDLIVYLQGGDSLFGAFWKPCIEFCKQAWDWIKKFWEVFQNTAPMQAVKSAISSFAETALDLFNNIIEVLGLCWYGFKRLIEIGESIGFFDTLADAATYFVSTVINGLNTLYSLFNVVFAAIIGLVTGDFSKLEKAWSKFCENFKALFESAHNFFVNGINSILGLIATVGNGIIELGHKIASALNLDGIVAKAKGAVASLIDYLPDFIKTDDMKKWIIETKAAANGEKKNSVENVSNTSNTENVLNTDNVSNTSNTTNNVLNTQNVSNTDNISNTDNVTNRNVENVRNTDNVNNRNIENISNRNTDNVTNRNVENVTNKTAENLVNKLSEEHRTFWNANEPKEKQYPHKRDENGQISWDANSAIRLPILMVEKQLKQSVPTHTQLARDSMTKSVNQSIYNNTNGQKHVTNNFTINSATPEMAKTAIETANDVGDNNTSVANSMMASS